MRMRQPYNLVDWCEVVTFCMTPTQQLKTMDQAQRTQESECGSRARAEETPEQRAQRLSRRREQFRERRARATARAFLRLLLGVLYLVLFTLPTSPLFARAFLLGTKLTLTSIWTMTFIVFLLFELTLSLSLLIYTFMHVLYVLCCSSCWSVKITITIIVHSSRTPQSSLLLPNPDSARMPAFFAKSKSTVFNS